MEKERKGTTQAVLQTFFYGSKRRIFFPVYITLELEEKKTTYETDSWLNSCLTENRRVR